jgi:hypothetical protein
MPSDLREVAFMLHDLIGAANIHDPDKVKVIIEFEGISDRLRFTDSAIMSQPWILELSPLPPVLNEIQINGIKFEFTSRAKRKVFHPAGAYEVLA